MFLLINKYVPLNLFILINKYVPVCIKEYKMDNNLISRQAHIQLLNKLIYH